MNTDVPARVWVELQNLRDVVDDLKDENVRLRVRLAERDREIAELYRRFGELYGAAREAQRAGRTLLTGQTSQMMPTF